MASFGEIAKLLLERANDVPGGNAARYYLGPAYNPIESVVKAMPSMLPGADMVDMTDNSRRLLDYQGPMETLGDAGWLGLSALGMALPGRPGALREPVEGITAYHGSPHDFDRFSTDKIGTGEGAQAYGHGLYFAENEGVARSYKTAGRSDGLEYEGTGILRMPVDQFDGLPGETKAALNWLRHETSLQDARFNVDTVDMPEALRAEVKRLLDSGAINEPPAGSMYEVRINANPDDFLDWDKPLSEQSGVTSRLEAAGFKKAPWPYSGWQSPDGNLVTTQDAESMYRAAGPSKEAAARALREAGIPGIRYLDQGSRAAGDGSRNYVVFDDNLVEILRKYGIAGLLAGGAGSLYGVNEEGERY